jgi:hypothetical protein
MPKEESGNLTTEQMKQMAEFMLPLIQAIKQPSELEQIQLNEKKAAMAAKAMAVREAGKLEMEREARRASGCDHMTEMTAAGTRKHLFRAQVHAPDGQKPYFKPFCTKCLLVGPNIQATAEQISNGVNLDRYQNISLEVLKQWAKATETVGV